METGLNNFGPMTFQVSEQRDDDWPEVWDVLAPAFREGLSYPLPVDVSENAAKAYWIKQDGYNGVARDSAGAVLGVYYIRPDQGGPGAHICNAGYVIAEAARGHGYAAKLCRQSQGQARAMGFRGMKFNLVVSTNAAAMRSWRRAGMEVIGVTPNAYRLPDGRYVDANIMFAPL